MWIVTSFVDAEPTVFEFKTEKEAREASKNIEGYKILTEVVSNDSDLEKRIA